MDAGPGGDGTRAGDGRERPGFGASRRGPPPDWQAPRGAPYGVRAMGGRPPAYGRSPYARPTGDRSGPLRPPVTTLGTPRWTSGQLPPKLPTGPTLLVAGFVVLLAFIVGHATGGGGSSTPSAATKSAVVVTTTTTTLPPRPPTHTVATGETLSSIAGLYGLQASDLATYNGISNINHVFVGEVLKIPPATTATTAPSTVTTLKR